MKKGPNVNVPELFRLWSNEGMSRAEIARALGITRGHLDNLASKHKLPKRKRVNTAWTMVDPTPEEIEERKAFLREKHLAELRAEPWDTTRSRVASQRRAS